MRERERDEWGAGKAWLRSCPAAGQGWRSEEAPICAGGGTSVMLAGQSCTNSHEAGCGAGGEARVQGWPGHPETKPGNHSGQGAPAQERDTRAGISPHLPTPAPHSGPGLLGKACSELSVWLHAALRLPCVSPPGHSLQWTASTPGSFPGSP